MVNQWSSQSPVHALVAAEQLVFLALPRYAGDGKNSSPIQLSEALLLPVYEGADSTLSWHPFRLRAGVVHLGAEPTSGHYRSFVRADAQWYLGDDSRPPSALISGNCYLLLLEVSKLDHAQKSCYQLGAVTATRWEQRASNQPSHSSAASLSGN